jgi:hypothetical protein
VFADIYVLSTGREVCVCVFRMSRNTENTTIGDSNLTCELSKYFGHQQFKSDLQRQATEAVLRSKKKAFFVIAEVTYY